MPRRVNGSADPLAASCKGSLSGVEKAGLSSAERAELQAARDVPELAPDSNIARQAQMAADGGTFEGGEAASRGLGGREYYRYVGSKELKLTREPEILRPGREPPDYFTPTRYSSRSLAQRELAIPAEPEYGIRFRFVEAPEISGPGRVAARFGQPGGGIELSIGEKARIELLEYFELGL